MDPITMAAVNEEGAAKGSAVATPGAGAARMKRRFQGPTKAPGRAVGGSAGTVAYRKALMDLLFIQYSTGELPTLDQVDAGGFA